MDLSIRDWLLIIGVLLLLAVALDGYRRARRERYNQVRLSRNALRAAKNFNKNGSQNDDILNGGARVVKTKSNIGTSDKNNDTNKEGKSAEFIASEVNAYDIDPLFADPFESKHSESDALPKDELHAEKGDQDIPTLIPDVKKHTPEPTTSVEKVPPEEVIWLNVMVPSAQILDPVKLKKILMACDCRYQDNGVFCRFEKENGQGAVQFSIVNMVEPGTFGNESLKDLKTPGVSFLLCLPGPDEPTEALNCMIETAQCLARNLNASIKDENLSSVTDQRLEHQRQQVRDFLKRKLLTVVDS